MGHGKRDKQTKGQGDRGTKRFRGKEVMMIHRGDEIEIGKGEEERRERGKEKGENERKGRKRDRNEKAKFACLFQSCQEIIKSLP